MRDNLFIFVAFVLLFFSCKKKSIETLPESNNTIFYVNGTLGNEAISYIAGDQSMVMQHATQIRNRVNYSYGDLTNGNNSIQLGIFDGHLSIENFIYNIKVGDTLKVASKFTDELAYLSKGNFSNDSKISNIDWYVNGMYKGSNHVSITEPGFYDICGNFTFSDDGSQKSICNKMFLGFEDDVAFSIKHFLSETGDLKLWIEGENQLYDSVIWEIDNEVIASGITHSTNIGSEIRVITATVYHQNGGVREKSIVIDGTFSGHFIEDFEMCKIPNTESKWDNHVGVEVKINGESYSSFEAANYKSSVLVQDVKIHEINAQGQIILRLQLKVEAMLKSLSTGLTKPIKFNAVFAYPVPN